MNGNTNQKDPVLAALRLQKKNFLHAGGFSALINILMLAPALYMLQVYDRVLSSGNGYTLLMLSLIVAAMFVLMGFLEWIRSRILIHINDEFDEQVAGRVFDASAEHQMATGSGGNAQQLEDLGQLRQFMTGSAVFAFFDAPWAPLYLIILFMFHPVLGTLALVGTILLFALAWINEQWAKTPLTESAMKAAQAQRKANSYLSKAGTAASMGMMPALHRNWKSVYRSARDFHLAASERSGLMLAISKTLRTAIQSAMLGAGAWLAINNQITPGMMIAGTILIGRMLSPVEQLVGSIRQWGTVKMAKQRLQTLLEHYPEKDKGISLPAPVGNIKLENITLLPPGGNKPTLTNLALDVSAGDIVGVIGSSGSGKSSFARLLAGIWQPRLGKVRFDGADISQWNREELGPHVGYLPQDVSLFAGTIGENIARFGDADDESIINAAKLAGVHDVILKMPEGYDTRLGDNGTGLSGGEQQRVGFARALYGAPRIVILDEPNANLDEKGEAALASTLQLLKSRNTTVILITHRAGVLNHTDKILILESGTVKGYGTKQQVMQAMQQVQTSGVQATGNVSGQMVMQ